MAVRRISPETITYVSLETVTPDDVSRVLNEMISMGQFISNADDTLYWEIIGELQFDPRTEVGIWRSAARQGSTTTEQWLRIQKIHANFLVNMKKLQEQFGVR
jgi:hypothetical protein